MSPARKYLTTNWGLESDVMDRMERPVGAMLAKGVTGDEITSLLIAFEFSFTIETSEDTNG